MQDAKQDVLDIIDQLKERALDAETSVPDRNALDGMSQILTTITKTMALPPSIRSDFINGDWRKRVGINAD